MESIYKCFDCIKKCAMCFIPEKGEPNIRFVYNNTNEDVSDENSSSIPLCNYTKTTELDQYYSCIQEEE